NAITLYRQAYGVVANLFLAALHSVSHAQAALPIPNRNYAISLLFCWPKAKSCPSAETRAAPAHRLPAATPGWQPAHHTVVRQLGALDPLPLTVHQFAHNARRLLKYGQ